MKRIIFILMMLTVLMMGAVNSYSFTNDEIANKAITYVGQQGGQCKAFIQEVIFQLGGALGSGYKQCYLDLGYEVTDHSYTMRGDIIQLYKDYDPESFYNILHTAVILENNNNGTFNVIDSNYCSKEEGENCEIVHQHIWNPYSHANQYGLQVHIFRIGNSNDFIRHKYDFLNGSSDGWTSGYDTENSTGGNPSATWTVSIKGSNPGIKSPQFNEGMTARFTKLVFSVKVWGNEQLERPVVWIKDETGSWNNLVELSEIIGVDYEYHIYQVNLEKVYRPDLEIKQFSLELTDGGNGSDEKWELDWLKVINTDPGLFSKLYITSQPSGDYTLNSIIVTNYVNSQYPYDAGAEKTAFYNSDNKVYSWLQLDNVYKSLNIEWKWYSPDNTLYYQYSTATLNPLDYGYSYWSWYRAYSYIDISSASNYGQWHADIYINGIKVDTKYFILNATIFSSPPPVVPPSISPPPTASFTVAPEFGNAPLEITTSNSSAGEITSYSWIMGDGTSSAGINTTHLFSTPGIYAITLTVIGPGGISTATKTIIVNPNPAPSPPTNLIRVN